MPDFDYVCGMASDDTPGETGHDYDHEVHAPEGFCGTGFSDVRRVAKKQLNTSKKPSVECRYCGKQGLTWFQPNIGRYRLKDQEGNEHICQEYFAKHGEKHMTRDDIIKMAHKAGFNWPEIHTTTVEERLERFFTLAYEAGAAAEREACAALAEKTICDTHIPTGVNIYGTRAARAIRARGNK
jgi:hypothetical protein